ncbi:MAG: ribonuclease HI family protein [Candidatus Microgenomates bacterium]|jgi:ribonuclease HI
MKDASLIIHTDGGSRGNPGAAACAFVAEKDGQVIFKDSRSLGKNTNNFAEYKGIILALEWLNRNKDKFSNNTIEFFADSELIVKQLNGIYKIKNSQLTVLNKIAQQLIVQIKLKILFKNIPRNENKIADFLVNEELDKET